MHRLIQVAAFAAGVVLPVLRAAPADAQVTTLRLGETVSGSLGPGDRMLSDSSRYDMYLIRGLPGEWIQITLRSQEFDAYLIGGAIRGRDFLPSTEDDDGGGDTDARLTVKLGADSSYAVRATSYEGGESGAYTLGVLAARGLDRSPDPTALGLGQPVSGRLEASDPQLDDGSFYDLFLYRGVPGESVVVTLRSIDFDAYLYGGRMEGSTLQDPAADDNGGGGTDARLAARVGADGTYWVRANSREAGRTGAYTLQVERP